MSIEIIKTDITDMEVDAIVNAANTSLLRGGGVCGAIFQKAGFDLDKECQEIGHCNTGEVVITKGLGIITGNLYSTILVNNIKFSQLYLVKQIETASYFKTAGFILLFALIIGIAVHFMLKKVKMIESLKSIE